MQVCTNNARELVHVSPARTGSLLHASVTIWCACCGAAWGCLISKGNKQPQLLLTLTSFLLLASLEHSMASSICIHTSFHFSERRVVWCATGRRMRMLQRGQSQLPKTPSHHMLSGPNPDFAANPPAGKVRVTPRTVSPSQASTRQSPTAVPQRHKPRHRSAGNRPGRSTHAQRTH